MGRIIEANASRPSIVPAGNLVFVDGGGFHPKWGEGGKSDLPTQPPAPSVHDNPYYPPAAPDSAALREVGEEQDGDPWAGSSVGDPGDWS